MSPTTIRLGTASPATQATTADTLALLERVARKAASRGVDILLLPEAFVGGYPRGTTFGCAVGSRSAEGYEEYRAYFRGAVDLGDTVGEAGAGAGRKWVRRELGGDEEEEGDGLNGKTVTRGDGTRERLEEIARSTGVFLVVGCIEKAGGSLYCAAVYVCPSRGCIGKRRKVMPTGMERLMWAQGSPATLRAVSTTIKGVRINMAAAICWESYMPLVRQTLYAQNINLYLAPTADGRDAWLSLMRTVGIEGRCFVVTANMCVREKPSHLAAASSSSLAAPPVAVDAVAAGPNGHRVNGTSPAAAASGDATTTTAAAPADPPALGRRRSSIITDDGFEIALPSPISPAVAPAPRTASWSPSRQRGNRRRRKSVFDEDGNEIVLCCDEDVPEGDGEGENEPSPQTNVADGSAAAVNCSGGAVVVDGPATTYKSLQPSTGGGFVSRGGSCIVGPFGDVLAGPQWEDDEGIATADVDFEDCIRGRLDLDAAGSYSRNDSFKFSVEGLDLSPLPY